MFSKAAVPRIALLAIALGGVLAVPTASAFPPGAPGTPAVTNRSTNSVSWVWSSALDADQYQVFVASAMGTPILTTSATNFAHSGLGPNGLSSIFVRGLNVGEDGPFSGQATAHSSAAVPTGLTVSSVTSVYVVLSWGAAGNPAETIFDLQKSLDGSSFASHSTYTATSATASALAANTTYYFRLRAFNNDTLATLFTSDVTTRTAVTGGVALPGPPATPSGVVQSTAEISWSWGAVSGATSYRVYLASKTYEFLASTGSPAFLHLGLRPGDSSGITVSAVNATGEGPQSQGAFKRTAVQPPIGTSVVSVTANSVTLSWGANGNPSGISYEVQRATEGGVYSAAGTFNALGATVSGLLSSTTYEFRVRAQNLDNLQTAFDTFVTTKTAVPFPGVPGNPSNVFISTAEVVWTWTTATDAANYEVRLATQSSNLLAFPSAPTFTHVLGPNALSSIIVRGANVNGTGLFTSTRSAHTLARPPVSLTVSTVTSIYVGLSWGADGNPDGTTYLVEKSTQGGSFEAHSTFTVTAATISILVPSTTYTFRVQAINYALVPTAYSGTASTVTAATGGVPPPGDAGSPSMVLISTRDVSWEWAGAANAQSYEVVLATRTTQVLATVLTTGFVHTPLGVNELSSIRVRGLNGTGPGSLSNSGSVYSRARTPSGLGFTTVGYSTVELFWDVLDNPVGTQYELEGSTEGGSFASLTGSVFGGATITGLVGSTTYMFRVRAYNTDNVPTAYTATASTRTLPPPPPAPGTPTALVLSTGDVKWSWTSSTTALSWEVVLATDVARLLASPTTTNVVLNGFGPNDVSAISVRGVNEAGAGALSLGATAYSFALPPTALTGVAAASTSITLNWTPTGNPTGMTYELQRATNGVSFLTYSTYATAAATVDSLAPGTTYMFRVRAANGDGVLTGFSGTLSTGTAPPLPGIPGTPGPFYVSTGVITWAWTPGTFTSTYELAFATNTSQLLASPAVSSATLTIGTPNTLSSVRARGINGGGAGAFSAVGQAYTLAMPPTALTVSAVTVSSITLDWGSNGNPGATNYEVQLSSGGGPFAAVATVGAAFVDLGGFSSSTAHNFRVRALNVDGLQSAFSATVSTTTRGLPPGPTGTPTPTFLSSTAVTWSWTAAQDALSYQVTRATNIAELVAAPTVSSFTLTLGANQPSAIVVRGLNATGAGPLSPAATVYTLPAAPSAPSFSDVTTNSADLTWGSGGNPAGTLFTLEASTGGPYVPAANTAALGASVSGLSSSTAYNFRVRAFNEDAAPGAYSNVSSTNTDPLLVPLPGAAGTPAAVSVSSADVSWSWSPASNADSYRVLPASNAAVVLATPTAAAVVFRAMTPNAPSGIVVRGLNGSGNGPLSASATVYTLARAPAAINLGGVFFSSVALSWDNGGNPAGTEFRLEVSTDGIAFSLVSTMTATAFLVNGLPQDTVFTFRVRAANGDAVPTAYATSSSTRTLTFLPGVPGTPSATFLSSLAVTWSWSTAADATSYQVYLATNTTELLASPAVSSFTLTLGANTPSAIVVRGVNGQGSGPLSAAATVYTLAAVPTALAVVDVTANSADLTWAPGGNPGGTNYQLEASTGGPYASAANTAALAASLSSLSSSTTYGFRIRAVNQDGAPGAYSGVVSTQTRALGGSPLPGAAGTPTTVFVSTSDVSWSWSAATDANRYKVFPASNTAVQLASPTAAAVTFRSMAPNAPSGIVVRGVNDSGNGPLSISATAYTLALPPGSVSVAIVYFSSASVSWTDGGNPAGTEYGLETSTAGGSFAPTTTTTASGFLVTGLPTDTDVSFRVRAQNADGVQTSYASPASTHTLRAVPEVPGSPAPVVVSTAAVSWTWGPAERADAYQVVLSSKTEELIASTVPATILLGGYTPNALSAISVRGTNVFGLGPLTLGASAYTLAMPPTGLTGVGAASSTLHLSWGAAGNSAGTFYELQMDPNATGFSPVGTFVVTEGTVSALTAATTYQFRVLARNGNNVPTAFSNVLTTGTAPPFPGVPGMPTASYVSTGVVTWGWAAGADAVSYQAFQASSTATLLASPSVSSFTVTIGPNQASGIVARGVNAAGTGPLSASATVYTLAMPPAALTVTNVSATSVDLVWSGNGNPAGTQFHLERSTNGTFFFPSGITTAAGASVASLSSSTAYHFRVRAANESAVVTAYSNTASTDTTASVGPLPGTPGKPFTVFVSSNDVSWVWAGSSDATGYRVFPASSPTTQLAAPTTNIFTVGGTGPNVPSGIVVAGTNLDGQGPLSLSATAYTLALAPQAMALGSVGASSVTMSWGSGGNPALTRYSVEYSLDGVFFVPFTTTTALSLNAVALASSTEYSFRVLARNGDGIDSGFSNSVTTTTLSPLPGPTGTPSAVSVSTNEVVWSWGSAFQSDSYQVYLASKTAELLAALGTTSYVRTLGPNQISAIVVRATNTLGAGPLSAAATTYTWARPPTTLVFTSVSSAATVMTWSANGNPTGTVYELQLSTDGALYTAFSTFTTAGATAALSASTTYFFQVRARNGDLVTTTFASAISTRTLPPLPGTPGTPFTASVSTGGVAWVWAGSSNAASYQVVLATKVAETLATPATNTFHKVLGPNEASGVVVRGLNATGAGALSASATAYSLAQPPMAFALATVSSAAVAMTWSANGNPAGTVYELQLSTDGALYTAFSTFTTAGATASALSASTTYFFQVRARNGDLVTTAFAASVSTRTLPPLPGTPGTPFATSVSTGGVAWVWAGSSNATSYQVVLATKVAETLATPATNTFHKVLGPNEAAGIVVRGINATGSGPLSASATTYSLAQPPTVFALATVSSASVAMTWSANGNPAGTVYELQISSDGTLYTAFSTFTTAGATASALSASTTYFFQVRARNADLVTTSFAAAVSTRTLPPLPGTPGTPFTASLSTGGVAWVWAGSSNATSYQVVLATNVAETLATPATNTFHKVLGPNEASGVAVRGLNATGSGSLSATATAYTYAQPPTAFALATVSSASVAMTWSANGNPAGTVYELQLSTDGALYTGFSTFTTAGATASALSASTTYFFQVRARNGDLVTTAFASAVSTRTMPPVPAVPGTPFSVSASTGDVVWTWAGAVSAASYQVALASKTSELLASPAMNLFTRVQGPNEPSGLVVRGVNATGAGALSASATVYTWAKTPGALSVTAVSSASAGLAWSANGNPAGTLYELQVSTDDALYTSISTYTAFGASATSLSPLTTYYFRVRARNGDAVDTVFAAQVSTFTLPPAPSAPGTPVGVAQGVSSVSWTWSAAASAAGYNVFAASAGAAGTAVSESFLQTGLAPNTSAGLLVAGTNPSGQGPLSAAATVYTLAAAPSGAAAAAVHQTSAALSWALNGNPVGTSVDVALSTDGAVFAAAVSTPASPLTSTDLLVCSSYWFRVRYLNGDGLASDFNGANFLTRPSTPSAPGGLGAAAVAGNRVSLSWTPSGSESVFQYRLYWDGGTGTVSYGAPLAVIGSTMSTHVTGVLASSASYRFALRAYNRCGIEESNTGVLASAPSLATLTGVRAVPSSPRSGQRVKGNRVTVAADRTLGDAFQVQSVLFQYKPSSASVWVNIPAAGSSANPDTSEPYFMHWDADALGAAVEHSIDLRAVAFDTSGSTDAAPSAVTVGVVPAAAIDFDVSEGLVGGKVVKSQVLDNTVTTTLRTGGTLPTRLSIPAGALASGAATVTVQNDPAGLPAPPTGAESAGSAVEISLSGGQTLLANGKTAAVTLGYPDLNGDGLVDGTTLRVDRLVMYSAQTLAGPWVRDFASSVDTTERTVTGNTPHFSFFALFTVAAASLDAVRVYPVPYMPNGGNPDQGVPYTAGNANSGIVFDNLPNSVVIKIYTVTGQRVVQFSTELSGGKVQWDVKNDRGQDVASGGYIAIITSPNAQPVTKRILIVR